jgi:outer membrane autotransporter protein
MLAKKKIFLCHFVVIFSGYAGATEYTLPIDLNKTLIKAGDRINIININGSGISGTLGNKNTINLGSGGVVINLSNTIKSAAASYGVKLEDFNNHNLGSGSEILVRDIENAAGIYGLYVNSFDYFNQGKFAELKANQLRIDVKNEKGSARGLDINHALFDLGSNSVIKSDGTNTNNTIGIHLDRNSVLQSSHLMVDVKNGGALGIEGGSKAYVGEGTKIIGSGFSVRLQDSSEFKAAKDLYLKSDGRATYTVELNVGNNLVDLGDGARIETTGDRSISIISIGRSGDYSHLTAKNLSIKNTGNASIGIYSSQAQMDIDGAIIDISSGTGVQADSQDGGLGPGKADISLKNSILKISGGSAVSAAGSNSKVNLDTVGINISTGKYGLASVEGAQMTATNTRVSAGSGVIGAYALNGGKLVLDGHTLIDTTGAQGMALLANQGEISVKGVANINGDMAAQGKGLLNLNTAESTVITGRIGRALDGSTVAWEGKGSTWNITGTSAINKLTLSEKSNINFANASSYNIVSVSELGGSSNFNFKVDFDSNQRDYLKVVESSAGNHTVSLVNKGSAATDGSEKITIIETPDGVAKFKIAGEYELGGYLYGVRRENNDPASKNWEVASTGKKTKPADASISTVLGNYLINLAEQENLTQRMGSLRFNNQKNGAWARTYGGKFNSFDTEKLRGFDMSYSGIQLGADGEIRRNEYSAWHLGGALSFTDSKQNYSSGSGKQKSYGAAIYATYWTDAKWYADMYFKYAHYKNDIDVMDSLRQRVQADGSNNGVTASIELGKRLDIGESFYVEPSAQLVVSSVSSDTLKNSNGLRVELERQDSLITRIGSKFGFNSMVNNNLLNLYAKLSFSHEFKGEQKYRLNGSRGKIDFDGSWLEYGVGANLMLKKQHTMFLEVSGNSGKQFDKYDYNIGYRYLF